MTNYAPLARIILRYAAGAGMMGSQQLGEQWATNPDLILIVSGLIGLGVEAFYVFAKRKGWNI